jgi:prepilin-type N-terminal cleavage/methylation domain-containing protein
VTQNPVLQRAAERGFTLVEMIVVVFLLAIAMLGLLAVFDASARINKNEQQVADAQGYVRYGIYKMTSAIRDAGTGGLYVTQAVLNHNDPNMPGITVVNAVANSYDNVQAGTTVLDNEAAPRAVPVRPGTDMIEIRGVINTPLLSFDGNGDGIIAGAVKVKVETFTPFVRKHVNDDSTSFAAYGETGASRTQFSLIDSYAASASPDGTANAGPMFLIVSGNDNLHSCSGPPSASVPYPPPRYPQPNYNVGAITAPTNLQFGGTFGGVDFVGYPTAIEFNDENLPPLITPPASVNVPRRGGILDDLVYFIDNTDPLHPALAQGTRRGASFSVVTLAEDVEDMQIAYGVAGQASWPSGDTNVVGRLIATGPNDPDQNVSTQAGGDEWLPNVTGDTVPGVVGTVYSSKDFVANGASPDQTTHCPRLHAVMISLLAKSKDPDPTYKAPSALGFRIMNTPAMINAPWPDTAQYASGVGQYRRRIQTLKINLRNYAFNG